MPIAKLTTLAHECKETRICSAPFGSHCRHRFQSARRAHCHHSLL